MSKFSAAFLGLVLPITSLAACVADATDANDSSPRQDDLDVTAASATALSQIQFGDVTFAGTGCKPGTATIALSPDHTTLSLTASAYSVATGGAITNTRKFCDATVVFTAPAGIRLGIASATVAGNASVPASGTGKLTVEKRFPFGSDDTANRDLVAPVSGAVSFGSNASTTWSGCGGNDQAIIHTALQVGGTSASIQGTTVTATLVAGPC